MYLEALVAVEVGPLELLHPLLHDLLRQQRHRHLHEQEVPRAIKHQAAEAELPMRQGGAAAPPTAGGAPQTPYHLPFRRQQGNEPWRSGACP